jgi:hypothetical protein
MAALLRHDRDLTRDVSVTEAARQHLGGNERVSPVEQLEIYREQFWLRHTGSLIEDFPGLSGILGQEDWEKLAVSYLRATPPTHFSLRDLGHALPAHVEACTWLPHQGLCVDMARLEWAYVELFDAREAPPLDAAKIGKLPEEAWETARIVLSPALTLLPVTYPVADLRRRLKTHPDEPVAIPEPSPSRLVLYRGADLSLYATEVSEAAFALLRALKEGVPLVPACERAAAAVPAGAEELEAKTGEWFLDWGRRGWVVDVAT